MFTQLQVMIKESDEWSESLTHFFLPNTKSYLAVTPTITETSTNTRRLHPSKRRCLFAVSCGIYFMILN